MSLADGEDLYQVDKVPVHFLRNMNENNKKKMKCCSTLDKNHVLLQLNRNSRERSGGIRGDVLLQPHLHY